MENPRRQFKLSSEEEAKYLNGLGLDWETVNIGNQQWVVIYGWKLPGGYNHTAADLALLIPPSYPDVEINMFYVKPALARADNKSINNLSNFPLDSDIWQQWSRHRTSVNPWRAGEDDLVAHLALVTECLIREVS